MIDEIHVENVALIRKASLMPSTGLTVLTGETGAGKTALLSACKLLMGERADRAQIREGNDFLEVAGRFFGIREAARMDSDAPGLSGDVSDELASDDGCVVVRRVSADGKSRVSIDGRMAGVGQLARMVAASVDLCGQHEHQQLMKPANHRRMLDAWAADGVSGPLADYRIAFDEAEAARAQLERIERASELSTAKLDEARFVLRRIDEVRPEEGEYEQLVSHLERAEHAEALAVAANGAYEALAGEHCAIDAVNTAVAALDGAARYDGELSGFASSLREACYVLEDVAADVRSYRDDIDFDADELSRMQERASAIQGLLRSYGPRIEDVFAHREEAADLVSIVDDSARRLHEAQEQLAAAEERLAACACALDDARREAAPAFSQAVCAQMARLEMGGAELVCELRRLDRDQWTCEGPSSVEFLFRAGAGMQPRPFAKIASGGEASRVMLAIKVVLGQRDEVETLIFDEVDAGVGGAVARALAEVLADLAKTHQVIVVTHLAQVAVRADAHYLVEKTHDDVPETKLVRIDGEARVREVARMLSGDASEASLAHAREMIEEAR